MKTALITGATAGIGREFARQLASAHINVVLVARDQARLETLAYDLHAEFGIRAEVIPADLATEIGRDIVRQRLTSSPLHELSTAKLPAAPAPVDILVNNAGFGLGQDFISGDLDREIEALNVMVRAVMELSHTAARSMRERGRGAIINVASITSLTAQGTYSAHKAWVRTFTEGLAEELRGSGVSATVVCPGLTRTEFHERSGVNAEQWPDVVFSSAADVVAEAIEAAKLQRVIVTPTWKYRAVAGVLRIAPRFIVRRVAGPSRSGRN